MRRFCLCVLEGPGSPLLPLIAVLHKQSLVETQHFDPRLVSLFNSCSYLYSEFFKHVSSGSRHSQVSVLPTQRNHSGPVSPPLLHIILSTFLCSMAACVELFILTCNLSSVYVILCIFDEFISHRGFRLLTLCETNEIFCRVFVFTAVCVCIRLSLIMKRE